MDLNAVFNDLASLPPQEAHKMMMDFFAAMPYERFAMTRDHWENTLTKNARQEERKEIICRLVAAGMSVDDIALAIVEPIAEVQAVVDLYSDKKILGYKKTFKQRQKRKQQQGG
jgi:hypothetical protein